MRRYWIDATCREQDEFRIQKDLFHHIIDVCRHQVGDHFELLCEGRAFEVKLARIEKKSAHATVLGEREIPRLPSPRIHLALSIPRFPVMESILERAVEMGVASLQPFFSEFSFIRSADKISEERVARWRKIILSATQQCGRGDLMELREPLHLEQLEAKVGLFAFEGASDAAIREYLPTLKNSEDLWLFVGSEGGFAATEVEIFRKWGLPPCTLGKQVLRVETACLSLISVIKYELNLWK